MSLLSTIFLIMIFSLLFILFSSPAFSSTLFIGNGGEVYKINNAYYLRDLVEADAHTQPYIHCAEGIRKKPNLSKLSALGIDTNLLERKLCDLETVVPGMGDILAATINFHSWTLVNETLVLQADDAPLLKVAHAQRVQAANRTLFNIRLQAGVWKSLTSRHRIALVFHEVIFSLLKITCTNSSCTQFKQSSRLAREITGLLFSENTFKADSEIKKLNSLIQLSFYTAHPAPEIGTPQFKVRVTISNNSTINIRIDKPDDQDLTDYIYTMCREYYNLIDVKQNWTMSVFIIRRDWNLEKFSYPTEYGVEYGIAIKEFSKNAGTVVNGFNSYLTCEKRLMAKIQEFAL